MKANELLVNVRSRKRQKALSGELYGHSPFLCDPFTGGVFPLADDEGNQIPLRQNIYMYMSNYFFRLQKPHRPWARRRELARRLAVDSPMERRILRSGHSVDRKSLRQPED